MAAPGMHRWGRGAWIAAPHRPCFGAAVLLWLVASAGWAAAVLVGVPPAASRHAGAVHALVFVLGPMPLFIAGFLFTAGPRWLKTAAVAGRWPAIGAGLVLAGWFGLIAATALDAPAARSAGLVLAAAGWLLLVVRLWALRRRASAPSHHFAIALAACSGLPPVLLAGAVAAAADGPGAPGLLRALAVAGLWWIVVPVFVVAVHRMLPFFESDPPDALTRRWPQASLTLALAAAVLTGACAAWPDRAAPEALQALAGVFALALALLSAQRAWHWGRHRARRATMLAMLHRAWLWWALAWAGLALSQWPALQPGLRARLDDAALHALTLGFLGGTMLAMVTRVSATQAGRAAPFDRGARALEALVQVVTAARVAAALLPALAPAGLAIAALGWTGLAGAWLVRHADGLIHGPPAARRPPRPPVPTQDPGPAGPNP